MTHESANAHIRKDSNNEVHIALPIDASADQDTESLLGVSGTQSWNARRTFRNIVIAITFMAAVIGILWAVLPNPKVVPQDVMLELEVMQDGSVGINVSAPLQSKFSNVHKATISSAKCTVGIVMDESKEVDVVELEIEGFYVILTDKESAQQVMQQELVGVAKVTDHDVLRTVAIGPVGKFEVNFHCSITSDIELYWGLVKLKDEKRFQQTFEVSQDWFNTVYGNTTNYDDDSESATIVNRMLEWLNHTWTSSQVDGVVVYEPSLPAVLPQNRYVKSCVVRLPDTAYDITPTVLGELVLENAAKHTSASNRAVFRVGFGAAAWELVAAHDPHPSKGRLYVACAGAACDHESVGALLGMGVEAVAALPLRGMAFSASAAAENSVLLSSLLGEEHSSVVSVRAGRTGLRRFVANDYPETRCIEADFFDKWRGLACGDIAPGPSGALIDFPHAEVVVAPPAYFDESDSQQVPIFQMQAELAQAEQGSQGEVEELVGISVDRGMDSTFTGAAKLFVEWDQDVVVVDHTLHVDIGVVQEEMLSSVEAVFYAVLDIQNAAGVSEWMWWNKAQQTYSGDEWSWPVDFILRSTVTYGDEQAMEATTVVGASDVEGGGIGHAEMMMEWQEGEQVFGVGTTVEVAGLDDGQVTVTMTGMDDGKERLKVQLGLTSTEADKVFDGGLLVAMAWDEASIFRFQPSLQVDSTQENVLGIAVEAEMTVADDPVMAGDLNAHLDFREDPWQWNVQAGVAFGAHVEASMEVVVSQGLAPLNQDLAATAHLKWWDDEFAIEHTHQWSVVESTITVSLTPSLEVNSESVLHGTLETTMELPNEGTSNDLVLHNMTVTNQDSGLEQLYLALRMSTTPRGDHDNIFDFSDVNARWKSEVHATGGNGYLQHGLHDGFPDTTWRILVQNENSVEKFYFDMEIAGKSGYETQLVVNDRLHMIVSQLVRTDGTEWMVGEIIVQGAFRPDHGMDGSVEWTEAFDQEEWMAMTVSSTIDYSKADALSISIEHTFRTAGTPRWSFEATTSGSMTATESRPRRAAHLTGHGELRITDRLGNGGDLFARVDGNVDFAHGDGVEVEAETVFHVPAWDAELDVTHSLVLTWERALVMRAHISENERRRVADIAAPRTVLLLDASVAPHGSDTFEDFFTDIGMGATGITVAARGVAFDTTFGDMAMTVATDGPLEGVGAGEKGKITCFDVDMAMNWPLDMEMRCDMRSSQFQFPWNLDPAAGNNHWMSVEHMTMDYEVLDAQGAMSESNVAYTVPPACDATGTFHMMVALGDASDDPLPEQPVVDTPKPLLERAVIVKLVVATTLEGMTAEEFDEGAAEEFKEAVASVLPSVDASDVIILSVSDVSRSRRRALLAAGVRIDYELVGFESEEEALAAEQVFTSSQSSVVETLQASPKFSRVTGISSEVTTVVEVVEPTPATTPRPAALDGGEDGRSSPIMVYVAVAAGGGIAALAITAAVLFLILRSKRNNPEAPGEQGPGGRVKRNSVVPLVSDAAPLGNTASEPTRVSIISVRCEESTAAP